MSIFIALTIFLLHALLVPAQFAVPKSDRNTTILRSPANSNVTVRFKTPPIGTCTTVFPSQKQYAGYVTLPPFSLAPIQQDYTINTFFWFIEARNNASTAPLTIYLNGGPGSSSMVGLFQEAGPCEVVEMAQGRLGTQPRDWGWDRGSNILFIDQPNEVGFSYDEVTNGSMDLLTYEITQPPAPPNSSQASDTVLNGTFSSNNARHTANTTQIAAHAIWHMLQGFLGAFPQYNPGTSSNITRPGTVGINLFTESYGGKYGPAFARLWEQQNQLRKNGSLPANKTLEVKLTSLGLMQACVDDLVQGRYYPIFANNNTYGIQALSTTDQQNAASSYLNADGCQQQIQSCRDAVSAQDPKSYGNVDSVNDICQGAQLSCQKTVIGPFGASNRDPYDITQMLPDPFPPSTFLEYLNYADVQAAIGVPINYTYANQLVANAFQKTGDAERGDQIEQIAYLLSLGIHVALIYGDRDYLCNWQGGQAVSFAIAAAASPAYSAFYTAGYADIVVNTSYVGGVVRQYGNLSFSRIYNAGHLIPAYQPETAFTVFARIITGNDISLGGPVDLATYTSNGTANSTFTAKAPPQLSPTCWVRDVQKCSQQQLDMLKAGTGTIINGVLYDNAGEWQAPPASVSLAAGYPGVGPVSTVPTALPPAPTTGSLTVETEIPTGVFTATGTPTASKVSSAGRESDGAWWVVLAGVVAVGLGAGVL